MTTIPAVKYTSLRDIMPYPPPSPASNNLGWNEITIKNPLVKQAALAYLQPACTPPEVGNNGLFDKFKENCFRGGAGTGELGCLEFLSGVVLKPLKDFVRRGIDKSDVGDQEDEREHKQGRERSLTQKGRMGNLSLPELSI